MFIHSAVNGPDSHRDEPVRCRGRRAFWWTPGALKLKKFSLEMGGALVGDSGGTGPPLILIHGWALDRRMWGAQRLALRRHFTTMSYDRRGFGESTCAVDAGKELDDLDRLIGVLKLGRTALLGMSQGGRVALRYALAHPDNISALVLQGARSNPIRRRRRPGVPAGE